MPTMQVMPRISDVGARLRKPHDEGRPRTLRLEIAGGAVDGHHRGLLAHQPELGDVDVARLPRAPAAEVEGVIQLDHPAIPAPQGEDHVEIAVPALPEG